jgi:hypothetical protein
MRGTANDVVNLGSSPTLRPAQLSKSCLKRETWAALEHWIHHEHWLSQPWTKDRMVDVRVVGSQAQVVGPATTTRQVCFADLISEFFAQRASASAAASAAEKRPKLEPAAEAEVRRVR